MKAKILFLLTVVVLVVSIFVFAHSPARASGTWYVSNSGDDSNDCASPTTTCASINGALNNPGFVAGDTVLVATGVYTGTGTEVVLINKDVTLSGGWDTTFVTQTGMATIDGENARRGITENTGITVSIDHFGIDNGSSNTGAGVLNSGVLSLSNCRITNDVASWYGGGIVNSGTLIINGSAISNNTATSYGGGIVNSGTMTLTRSTIDHNTCDGSSAGIEAYGTNVLNSTTVSNNIGRGIYSAGNLTLNNSTVSGNAADGSYGGGIYHINWGLISINSSTITGNRATLGGGGLYLESGYYAIQNSILIGNSSVYSDPDCWGGSGTSNGYCIAQIELRENRP